MEHFDRHGHLTDGALTALIRGDETGNSAYLAFLTREQAAALFRRLYELVAGQEEPR